MNLFTNLFMNIFIIAPAVLLLCVLGMSVGVIMGRRPIKHCGAAIDANGNKTECSLCGNTSCKNNKKADVPPSSAQED